MRFLFAAIIALFLSACLSEPDCIQKATNVVKISFVKSIISKTTGLPKDTIKYVFFKSITIPDLGIAFTVTDSASVINLPVNPQSNRTTFLLTYLVKKDPTTPLYRTDSLTFTYAKQNIIISPTCGAVTYYSGLSVPSSTFDTQPTILNSQLFSTTSTSSNVKIRL